MTTINTDAAAESQQQPQVQPAPVQPAPAQPAAVITEQQVMLGSAAALAPAPARRWNVVAAVRAMFAAKPEKEPHGPKHYPQRFSYLESSAMSREMDRL
jgi:hypothetical protein